MTIGDDACCSVLEPLQLQDASGIAKAPNKAVVLEVRLNDASIRVFTIVLGRKCLAYVRKPIAQEALSGTDFLILPCQIFFCLNT